MTDTLAALIEKIDGRFHTNAWSFWQSNCELSWEEWHTIRDTLPVWRPIETAPMDARKILVWDKEKASVYTIRADDLKQRRVFHWMQGYTHWAPINPPETI